MFKCIKTEDRKFWQLKIICLITQTGKKVNWMKHIQNLPLFYETQTALERRKTAVKNRHFINFSRTGDGAQGHFGQWPHDKLRARKCNFQGIHKADKSSCFYFSCKICMQDHIPIISAGIKVSSLCDRKRATPPDASVLPWNSSML